MSGDVQSRAEIRPGEPGHGGRVDSGLVTVMALSLACYWRQRQPYQTFLYVTAVVLLASGVFHGVLWLVTGDSWTDPVSWRKPTLFGISFGLTALSIGWVHTFCAHVDVWGGWSAGPSALRRPVRLP